MIFIKKVFDLLGKYESQSCGEKDNAFLYGMCTPAPPIATHIVYAPMPDNVKWNLINNYKLTIPAELLTLYSAMNGADLFWTVRVVGNKNTRIPMCCFSIYGVPLTCDREHIEPFSICIEDLNRPQNTPDSWLKFGSYYRPGNTINRLELFVDTKANDVFAVAHDCVECCVVETWESIDSCLCSLLDMLQKAVDKGTEISSPPEKPQ